MHDSCGCREKPEEQKPNSKTSRLAIASLVLGILGYLFRIVTAIPGIILGIIALTIISKSSFRLKGKGLAITGITISIVWIFLYVLVEIPALITMSAKAKDVEQEAQLNVIETTLNRFKYEFRSYPPSSAQDSMNQHYCGAQKLSESLLGQDLMGFNPKSEYRSDGKDSSGKSLYIPDTVHARRPPFLELENANIYQLKDIFRDVGPFDGNSVVICDVYTNKRHSGMKTGLPILYYKADASRKTFDDSKPMDERIYNAEDNLNLIRLKLMNTRSHFIT